MENVSQATTVTNKYVHSVDAVAESVGNLSETFQKTAAGLQQSASALDNSTTAISAVSDISRGYTSQIEGMNKNLAALNTVYETQLRNTNDQVQKSMSVNEDMEKMMGNIRKSMENVSQATSVTNKYVQSVDAVTESVGGLSEIFQKTAAGLQQSASAINNSTSTISAIGDSSKGYAAQLDGMNRNLVALNAIYEMQLRNTNDQMQKSMALYGDMERMLNDIKMSVEETHHYRDEMVNLNRNLASLNTVYGNMLSAMNVKG